MVQPGDILRPKRGRPTVLHSAQEEEIKEEAELRASRNRALNLQDVAVQMAGMASDSAGYPAVIPSEPTVKRLLERRGLLVRKANVTDKARIVCSKEEVMKYQAELRELREKEPDLKKRTTNANVDETPGGSTRGEKFFERQMFGITSAAVIRKQGGKQTRVAAIDDDGHVISFVPFLLGDGRLLCEIYIVSGKLVSDEWTKLPSTRLPADMACEFLPGIDLKVFERGNVAIYVSDSGSMTQELLKDIFEFTIIPCWRNLEPTGPLLCRMDAPKSHRVNAEFAALLLRENVRLLLLPHNSSTLLQPLDNGFNKWWRRQFKRIVKNLISVSQNKNFYLDDMMNVKAKSKPAKK
jgi:hypothetical protein